jgi:hypothetical protein
MVLFFSLESWSRLAVLLAVALAPCLIPIRSQLDFTCVSVFPCRWVHNVAAVNFRAPGQAGVTLYGELTHTVQEPNPTKANSNSNTQSYARSNKTNHINPNLSQISNITQIVQLVKGQI